MNNKTKLHMSTDEFRKAGYKAIDWIADYYEKIEDYPVMSQLSPNEIINNLPDNPPIKGKKFDDILKIKQIETFFLFKRAIIFLF